MDYFAVIPRANLKKDSGRTLAEIATAMRQRFPTTPGIRINGPAVQIPFGLDGAEHTEIIPVDATGTTSLGFRMFDMPDGEGGWMFSAPESHNAYVRDMDDRLYGKVRQLVRLVKAWRSLRNVPIRSFYLEMYVTRYANYEAAIIYDLDVKTILQRLAAERLPSIIDPRFPNDGRYLEPCSTSLLHADALGKLDRAASWAADAVSYKFAGKTAAAFDRWDLVFNYVFPSYTG